jgi:hypothetical protein
MGGQVEECREQPLTEVIVTGRFSENQSSMRRGRFPEVPGTWIQELIKNGLSHLWLVY